MKSNAKRILSFVLVLLMSLSMVTGIVLPAAAADDASDPYAKITGTKDGVAIIPDANVVFIDAAWATAPETEADGTFEYTYGDGTTWGNGKTYLLTWGVNAFAQYKTMYTKIQDYSAAWAKGTGADDYVLVFAPGEYGTWVYPRMTAKTADPKPEELLNIYMLGPQAGKSPVSADKSTKAKAKEVQNGRSTDVKNEAVFNTLFGVASHSNLVVDGFAGNAAFCFLSRGGAANSQVGEYCNFTLKNFYLGDFTTGWNQSAFVVGQNTAKNITWNFDNCYFKLDTKMTGTNTEKNTIFSNKIVFNSCVFADAVLSTKNPGNVTNQFDLSPAVATDVSANFYGTYAAKPLIEIKDSVVADWEPTRFFNFYPAGAEMSSYAGNAVKINIEGNKFLDVNLKDVNAPYPRMFSIEKIETQAQADSFELVVKNNYFLQSDELFGSAGYVHSFFGTNSTPAAIKIKSLIEENVFQLPNRTATLSFWENSSGLHDGPLFDLSGNLFMDNKGNIMPVRGWWSVNNTAISYWKVQSDLYASDEMKGGIRELMLVKEADNAIVAHSDVQLVDRASYTTKRTWLQGRVTLILKDGVEYDANKLFSFNNDKVEFLGVYEEEACTTKVDKITKANVHGKYAKAQYKTDNTTLTVVYFLYAPHTYLIVDPAGTYKTEGYTFNGVKYEDCKTAADGISAKFYTTINDAYGANGANMPTFHYNAIDALTTSNVNYTLEGIGTRSLPYNYAGMGTVILLTPGQHTITDGYLALRKNVAVVGPQWGVSPYGDANKEGKLDGGRSTNVATEAVINGYFTPAADSGWINTFIDGVAFNGAGYAFNTSHATSATMKSLYQAQVLKNCVFATNGSVVIGPETKDVATKTLDLVIKDCAFDTSAMDRRENANALITVRASMAEIENVAILSKYCVADKNAALAKLTATPAAVRGWTPADNAQSVANVNFYSAEHAEELVTDYTTSTATCIKGGTATAKCPVCQATATVEVPATGKHDHDTSKWASDATNHFHACKTVGCNDAIDVTAHTESEVIVDKKATNIENGTAHTECTVCKRVMQSNIILPPTGDDAMLDLAERFEAITATDENRDNILEPQGVIFVDPAFGKAPYTGTFEYTYGDGVTWGNGFTYTLTEGVSAYAKLYEGITAVKNAWNAHTGAYDKYTGPKTVVVAPGLYNYDATSGGNFTETGATDKFNKPKDANGAEIAEPSYDQLFRFTVVGPQTGNNPTKDINNADPSPAGDRSVDTTKEAVCNTTMRGVQNAIMRVDGFSFTGAWKLYDDAEANTIVAVELHNIYHYVNQDVVHWQWTEAYNRTRCLEIKNFYKDYTGLGDTVTLESDWLGSMGRLIIDNYYEDMTGITKSGSTYLQARQLGIGIAGYASVAKNLFGDGDKRVEIQIKNSTYNSHTNNHAFRFYFHHATQYVGYTTDDVIIDMHDNYFRNMGWGGLANKDGGSVTAGCDTIYIQGLNKEANGNDKAIQMAADALKFDFERNTFEYTSDIMKTRTSGHTLINFRAGVKAVFGEFHMKNNRVIMATEGARPVYTCTTNGYVLDASSWLYTDENGNVTERPRAGDKYHGDGSVPAADAYASDNFAGGVNELFTPVRGADMAIAESYTSGVIKNGLIPSKNIKGTILIVPYANAGTYAAEDLFQFRGKDVKVVKLLNAEGVEVTGKVNPNDLNGYTLVTELKGKTTTCTVTFAITVADESEYAFIDPTNSVTTYEFNGKTYTLDASNRFADLNGNGADTSYGKIKAAGKNVIVLLPGVHTHNNYQFQMDAAILGPMFGVSPLTEDFGLSDKRAITKNGSTYTVDTTKEALLKDSQITPYFPIIDVCYDGIAFENYRFKTQDAQVSYGYAEGGCYVSSTFNNAFLNGWAGDGLVATAGDVKKTTAREYTYFNEVYAAGKGAEDGYLINGIETADLNRTYIENVSCSCLIFLKANHGPVLKLSPGPVGLSITNSKLSRLVSSWNLVYTNYVNNALESWGSSGDTSATYYPEGFHYNIDNTIFDNIATAGTGAKNYALRLVSPKNNTVRMRFTNNTVIEDVVPTNQNYIFNSPVDQGKAVEYVATGNKFINLNNIGMGALTFATEGGQLDMDENYFAVIENGVEKVALHKSTSSRIKKSDWYYLDRAMTVRSCDVALVDNGYKAFEDKGFDGINNYVIDASESDLANLFKAAEGATVEGIYSDAACTQEATAASGTVYVKVSKNGISLANKVELTACDHKDKGTEDKITKEPTCYQTGLKDVVCAACGTALETGKEVAATGNHDWKTDWTVTETGHYKGCKTDGCTARNEAGDHKESDTIVDDAPGCSSAGKGHTVCTVCEKTINSNVTIPSTGKHSAADDLVVDKAPTCYASGIGHSVCKDCGITLESDITIPATEAHKWATEWTITDNLHYYVCTNDGCTFRNSASTHTAGDVITDKAPSCFEAGYGHKNCTVCGKTMETNVAISATGNHDWNTDWVQGTDTHYHTCKTANCPAKGAEADHEKELITLIPETCGEAGLGKYVCKVCDVLLEDNVVIEPTGKHTKGGLEIYEGMEPNCGYTGLGYKSCTVCGQTVEDNIVIAIRGEHVPGAVVMDQVAGCTTAGKGHIDCTVCGNLLDNVVVAATHTPGEWASLQPGKEAQSCSVCGIILEIRDVLPEGSAPVDPAERFDDVDADDWYFEAVTFVVDEGLFNGTSDTEFSPNANMTRAMFVTVLGRLHGVKETKASTQFTDVKKSAYYSGYVAWAAKNSIVNGVSDTKFAPDANITREQIAVMMVRYMNFAKISAKKINTKITFKDASSISGYAKSAVATCQTAGIVNGIKVSGGYNFNPKANATRAQVATIMMNFCENYK